MSADSPAPADWASKYSKFLQQLQFVKIDPHFSTLNTFQLQWHVLLAVLSINMQIVVFEWNASRANPGSTSFMTFVTNNKIIARPPSTNRRK
jgi:hypothetical protein